MFSMVCEFVSPIYPDNKYDLTIVSEVGMGITITMAKMETLAKIYWGLSRTQRSTIVF